MNSHQKSQCFLRCDFLYLSRSENSFQNFCEQKKEKLLPTLFFILNYHSFKLSSYNVVIINLAFVLNMLYAVNPFPLSIFG